MADLQVLLLGPPEVRYQGEILAIPRRATRALLFYLAAQGRHVSRDQMLTLFWEEQPETTARRNLRDLISRLKHSLPLPELVYADTSLVGLDLERVYVDQLHFQELIEQAGRLPWKIPADQPLPDPAYLQLKEAAGLWRGPNYLAGANFPSTPSLDEWLERTSQAMEQLYGRVLLRLANHAQAVGDLEDALELIRAALANDEWNDELHLRLLDLLLRLERISDARQHFEQYRRLLRRELGAEPSPALVELYNQMRASPASRSQKDVAPRWSVRPSVEVPFIGRQEILKELQRSMHNGGAVFIFGEAGQGKTRLLQEFTAHLSPRIRLLVTTCRQAESNLPFQPLIELLRTYIQPEEWAALPSAWSGQLALLLPELSEATPQAMHHLATEAKGSSAAQFRALFLEALRQVFVQLSKNQRLLLCIEDIHWADEATLVTLAYLIDRPPFATRGLLLATARWEEDSPHLEAMMASLEKAPNLRLIALPRFSPDETRQLAAHVLGYLPSDAFITQLLLESGGNPFIILESLRAIVDQGLQPTPEDLASHAFAQGLQSLIDMRLATLSPLAKDVIQAAAVFGADFDPESLHQITQYSLLQISSAIEELEKRRLVELAGRSPLDLRYRFIHDIFREALLQKIHPVRKRWLHRRIAKVLEQTSQSADQSAVLAWHYELAGDIPQALQHWLRAGQRAYQLYSFKEAEAAFAHAERLAQTFEEISDRQLLEIFTGWSEIASEQRDAHRLQQIHTRLLRFGEARQSPLLLGSALDGLSAACLLNQEYEQGLALSEQAVAHLQRAGQPVKLLEALLHRAALHFQLKQFLAALEAGQQALQIEPDSSDAGLVTRRANAHLQLANTLLAIGQPESALSHASLGRELYTQLSHLRGQIAACQAQARSRTHLGEHSQALQDCHIGMELAQRLQLEQAADEFLGLTAINELALGNLEHSLELADHLLESSTRSPALTTLGYCCYGDAYTALQRPEQAAEYYQRAMQADPDSELITAVQISLEYAIWRAQQTLRSTSSLAETLQPYESMGCFPALSAIQLAWCEHPHAEGAVQHTCSLLTQISRQAGERHLPAIQYRAMQRLCRLSLLAGEVEAAIQVASAGAESAARLSHVWMELSFRLLIEEALTQKCQREPGNQRRILELFDLLEARVSRQPFKAPIHEHRNRFIQRID